MNLRIAIWKLEAKLIGLMLLEACALALLLTLFVAELVVFPVYMWGASLGAYFRIAEIGASGAFAFAVYYNVSSTVELACDEPLREPLGAWPELDGMVRELARELRRPAPATAVFFLSPAVWRRLGYAPGQARGRGETPVPAACLAIWPIMSLRCHIAHALVHRRDSWLTSCITRAIQNSMTRLSLQNRRGAHVSRLQLKPQWLLNSYLRLALHRAVLADIEADGRVARLLGGSAVATWICQTHLAGQVAPQCLRRVVEPAADHGVLLPIAAACAALYGLAEPGWLATVESQRIKAQQAKKFNPSFGGLLMRLAVLPGSAGTVHDPRAAASLFRGLEALEERLLRHELSLGTRPLRRSPLSELDGVILPAMREEVDRNAEVFAGRSLADLPDLVLNIPTLAASYRADPRYLFTSQQRKALVPGLLASFLAVELEREGWRPTYTIPPGLTLERCGRSLSPQQIVTSLQMGKMSREAFRELVNSDSPTGPPD